MPGDKAEKHWLGSGSSGILMEMRKTTNISKKVSVSNCLHLLRMFEEKTNNYLDLGGSTISYR